MPKECPRCKSRTLTKAKGTPAPGQKLWVCTHCGFKAIRKEESK